MSRLGKNPVEWSVFAVALLLVLATLGYLVSEALGGAAAPPDIVVTLGPPRQGAGGYSVPVTAENRGEETAEEVRVRVTLEGGPSPEEAVLIIPYIPRESRRQGWVAFQGDPGQGRVRVAGVAFQTP